MMHFVVRFRYVVKRLERLNSKTKRVDNRKLVKLIYQHNRIQFELAEINNFWKDKIGWNVVYFFAFGIIQVLIAIHVDIRLEMNFLAMVIVMYLTCIYGTFAVANKIPAEVSTTFVV